MKLASFQADGKDRIGYSPDGASLVDLASAIALIGRSYDCPRTMIDLLEGGAPMWSLVQEAVEAAGRKPDALVSFPLSAVVWHPPVRRPLKVCCLALNNSANADRIMKGPKTPAIFLKTASSLVGHGQPIVCKPSYGRAHPEPELAVVIGKRAKNVKPEDGFAHVFGYTIMNDITSPTMRGEDTFHYRAIHPKNDNPGEIEYVDSWVSYSGRYKGADTFGCLGPWIVTRDEIPDPHDLDVSCHHQGRLITEDNTANLFHKTADVVSFISHYMTLDPGDVIAMGTALKKSAKGGAVQNVDLNKYGGPISVTIEGIGTLSNPVTHEDD